MYQVQLLERIRGYSKWQTLGKFWNLKEAVNYYLLLKIRNAGLMKGCRKQIKRIVDPSGKVVAKEW